MPHLTIVDRDGREKVIAPRDGVSLMEAIRSSGFGELQAICGGCCSCATCQIYVDLSVLDSLPPVSEDENDLLDSSEHRKPTSRLACQVPASCMPDGSKVEISPED